MSQDFIAISFVRKTLIFDDGHEIPVCAWFDMHGRRTSDCDNAVSFYAFDQNTKMYHVGSTQDYVYATRH